MKESGEEKSGGERGARWYAKVGGEVRRRDRTGVLQGSEMIAEDGAGRGESEMMMERQSSRVVSGRGAKAASDGVVSGAEVEQRVKAREEREKESAREKKQMDRDEKKQKRKEASRQRMERLKAWVKKHKVLTALIAILVVAVIAGIVVLVIWLTGGFNGGKSDGGSDVADKTKPVEPVKYYSKFTGLEVADEKVNSSPIYCMQIPNGMDGARPQAGLSQAGVVFEAIAEAGITRFAALFQEPTASVLGPIRSLRSYYLDWDTPFDCTVVHAGGSSDALQALKVGGYRDLTEDYTYMWRDYSGYMAPNNLFTSPTLLKQFNDDNGWTTSDFKAFPRMTPEVAAEKAQKVVQKSVTSNSNSEQTNCIGSKDTNCATAQTDCTTSTDCVEATECVCDDPDDCPCDKKKDEDSNSSLIANISVNFGSSAGFNVNYVYDVANNRYLRYYADGTAHTSYNCPAGVNGENVRIKSECGEAEQLAPSAVVVMMVDEWLDSDRYHQVIKSIGSGTAYVFQNGMMIEALWQKASANSQIEFRTKAGGIVSFTPGQLWISAVPSYGGVSSS